MLSALRTFPAWPSLRWARRPLPIPAHQEEKVWAPGRVTRQLVSRAVPAHASLLGPTILFLIQRSVTSHWSIEISHGRFIYANRISKYKAFLFRKLVVKMFTSTPLGLRAHQEVRGKGPWGGCAGIPFSYDVVGHTAGKNPTQGPIWQGCSQEHKPAAWLTF